MKEIKVIYISGYGRSGSTLLDIILSSQKQIEGCGELCNLFNYILESEKKNNDVWQSVAPKAAISNDLSFDEIERYRFLFETFALGFICRYLFKSKYDLYKNVWRSVFIDVAEKEEAAVLIDSSKTAWKQFHRPFLLKKIFGNNFFVIHLHRGLGSVKDSMKKGDNIKMENNNENVKLILPNVRATVGLYLSEIFFQLYKRKFGCNIFKLKFESFVKDSINEIEKIENIFNLNLQEVKNNILSGKEFNAKLQFSGNRMRLSPVKFNKPLDENNKN